MTTEVEVVNRGPSDVAVDGQRIRPNESKSFHVWRDVVLEIEEIVERKAETVKPSVEALVEPPAIESPETIGGLTIGEVFDGVEQNIEPPTKLQPDDAEKIKLEGETKKDEANAG